MKFDAWPVEPPGFGNGPLSIWTTSVQPSSVSQPATLLPTMPPPITTTLTPLAPSAWASSYAHQDLSHRGLEVLDVVLHEARRAVGVSDDDRLDEVAMRLD